MGETLLGLDYPGSDEGWETLSLEVYPDWVESGITDIFMRTCEMPQLSELEFLMMIITLVQQLNNK